MLILGIDPGASGAIVVHDGLYPPQFVKLNETEGDICGFLKGFDLNGAFAYIERVHSMPGQGVCSSFKFGQSYGFLRGLLSGFGIPFEEVSPQKWQKSMGCLSKGDKNVTKSKAQQLFPNVKVTHAIADALLIAEYGLRLKQSRGVK